MFLTPSFPLQSPAHFGLELKERRKNGAYKTCTCQYCPKMAHMFCTWDVVTTNCLMSISSFSKRSLWGLPYYSSCFLGRFSSSGPAGLPRPHLKPRGDLLGAVVCAFSGGGGQTSVLCVPNCRELPNSAVTRPPTWAQEVALSMLLLGVGSDLKHGSLQINPLGKWVPSLFPQSYCIRIVAPNRFWSTVFKCSASCCISDLNFGIFGGNRLLTQPNSAI